MDQQSQPKPSVRKRFRFRKLIVLRWAITLTAISLLFVACGLWMVTRSWFIIAQVRPELERKLGGDIQIRTAKYEGDGRIKFTDVSLRARNVPGKAAEVATIGTARVTIDLRSLLRGSIKVMDVELDDAELRLSEDMAAPDRNRMNTMALTPDWSKSGGGQGGPPDVPPRVHFRKAALEFGSHYGSTYQKLGRRLVSGLMYPTAAGPSCFYFELGEVDENGRRIDPGGIFIKGEWNAQTNEHHCRIDGLELDDRVYQMCPHQVRMLCQQRMQLEGKVDGVAINWIPGQPYSVEFDVRDVGLTLPIDTEQVWARYRGGHIEPTAKRPRLHASAGTIRVASDSLSLKIMAGELSSEDTTTDLVGVPYSFEFSIPSFPPIAWDSREQWLEQVLKTAPFELKFHVNDFKMQRNEGGAPPAIDLPVVVAKALARFQMTDWVLTTAVTVSRGEPSVGADGNLVAATPQTNGSALIQNASGRFEKFPFLLEQIEAYITYDNLRVIVQSLTGKGSGNSQIRISGVISPPEGDASISLHLTGTNVPLDDRFRDALTGNELLTFDAMFNKAAAESMSQAGLLPSEKTIAADRVQRELALKEIDDLKGGGAEAVGVADDPVRLARLDALQRRVTSLERSIAAGPFTLGGMIDIDLQIDRERGEGNPTYTTGRIVIQSAGAVYENFAYPLRVTGGALDWKKDRIEIAPGPSGEGVTFVTPGGGRGTVTGDILFPDPALGKHVHPDLNVKVTGDEINDAVYAAIPLSQDELDELGDQSKWPGGTLSRMAKLVRGIGLAGSCDHLGNIGARDDGRFTFDFDVALQNGTASPRLELAEALGAEDELWPHGLTLFDVHGLLHVSRDNVNWTDITGGKNLSTIRTSGSIDLVGEDHDSHIEIDMQNLPMQTYVLNMVPTSSKATALELWERYRPEGRFDAFFDYRTAADGNSAKTLSVVPRDCTLVMSDQRMSLKPAGGRIMFDENGLGFEEFRVDLITPQERYNGTVTFDGSLGSPSSDAPARITGLWDDGLLESPVMSEMISQFGSPEHIEQYRELQAKGPFDATFRYSSSPDESHAYDFVLKPHAVDALVFGNPVHANIDNGEFVFSPGQIAINDVRGRFDLGAFEVQGVVDTTTGIDARLDIVYNGMIRSPDVAAFLPQKALDAMDGIVFDDAGTKSNADIHLFLSRVLAEGAPPDWRTELAGRIETHGAQFETGVQYTNVHGAFDMNLKYDPVLPIALRIDSHIARATALGSQLTNIEAPITLEEGGELVRVPSLRADSGEGAVTASAWAHIGEKNDYSVNLEFVGVPLEGFTRTTSGTPEEIAKSAASAPTGEVYATFTLTGRRGDSDSRRGRGIVRILRGEIANIPLAMQVLQIVQLTMPFSGALDYADAEFYLVGDRMHFEHILFESTVGEHAMLQLFGRGEMNFDTLELNTRFRSRSGVAVIRDIVGGISDKLYEIELTGPLRDPKARIVALPSGE